MIGSNNAETGGLWTSRKPQFWRSLRYLLKKDIITKVRHFPSIIEFLGACTLTLLLFPIYHYARFKVPENPNPEMEGPANINLTLGIFLYGVGKAVPRIVLLPNCSNTRFLKAMVIDRLAEQIKINSTIVDTVDEMRNFIYQTDSNAIGLHWKNGNASDAMRNPQFTIYEQVTYGRPEEGLIQVIVDYLTMMPFSPKISHIDRQPFPTKKSFNEVDIQLFFAFFGIVPVILATMPVIQSIIDEKGEKITTLMFLMGMTELQYWIVNFVIMIGFSLIAYLFFALEMCYWFGMKGTDFSLFMAFTFLFMVAHTFFMSCVMVCMQKSEHGRSQAIVFAVFGIFFCYVHQFYTLQPNASDKAKHGMSIFPLSTCEVMVMNFYDHVKRGYNGYHWSDFYQDSPYKISWGFMWFGIDIVVYGIIFLLLNTFLPRHFGVQPMHIQDVFKLSAWKALFHGKGQIDYNKVKNADIAIKVDHLHKVFSGATPVTAVKDVSFQVKKGEVIVMIGPNGAGKSTIINTLSAAIKCSGGEISLFDGDPQLSWYLLPRQCPHWSFICTRAFRVVWSSPRYPKRRSRLRD